MKHLVLILSLMLIACDNSGSVSGGEASLTGSDLALEGRSSPDPSTTRLSEKGLYRVSIRSAVEPLRLNELHSWMIHVETADGEAVDNAEIAASGGMPEHNHGFPTAPKVNLNQDGGNYQLEGVKFSMPGWWEMRFNITANGQTDTVVFNVLLP